MRLSLLCTALSLLAVTFPTPAISNNDVVEQFDAWSVITRANSDYPTEPLCILSSAGDTPRFVLANIPEKNFSGPMRGSARLDIRLPVSSLNDGNVEIEAVRVIVPNHFIWSGVKGEWREWRSRSGLRILAFVDPRIDTVIPPLALGSELAIEIDFAGQTTTHSFDLTGSYAALIAYEKCLASVKWINATEAEES